MLPWWMAYLFLLLPKQPQTSARTPQVSIASEAVVEKTSSLVSAQLHDHNRHTLLVRTGGRRGDDWSSLHLHPSSSFPVFQTSGISWLGWGWPCLVPTSSCSDLQFISMGWQRFKHLCCIAAYHPLAFNFILNSVGLGKGILQTVHVQGSGLVLSISL